MRQSFSSESRQSEKEAVLPGDVTTRSIDSATLALLTSWQQEDATTDLAQLRAAEEELLEFMKSVNKDRASSGEPPVYQ